LPRLFEARNDDAKVSFDPACDTRGLLRKGMNNQVFS